MIDAIVISIDAHRRCVPCKNRATMKQKCELRRCRVLNPEFVAKKKSIGMLGVGVANEDVRVKARSSRRSAPPESREASNDEEEGEAIRMRNWEKPQLLREKYASPMLRWEK